MLEARLRGASRREFDALSDADQSELEGLVRYLEQHPEPDGRYIVPLNPDDEAQYLCVYADRHWRIVFHASSEASLIIYGITRQSGE
jgi:hypothetical protein